MRRILIFPGSQRRWSLNRMLAGHLGALLASDCSVDIVGADEVDLPLFNEDLEDAPGMLRRVAALHARFDVADGLIVASPEYNGSISPYLKNTIDWVSRLERRAAGGDVRNPFLGKPLLLASATSGRSGGLLGLQTARALFAYLGCVILPEQLMLPYAADAWDADGCVTDPCFNDLAAAGLDRLRMLARIGSPVPEQAAQC